MSSLIISPIRGMALVVYMRTIGLNACATSIARFVSITDSVIRARFVAISVDLTSKPRANLLCAQIRWWFSSLLQGKLVR